VTLALGMGANATIFTLSMRSFKPLYVSRPDELLTVHENAPDAAPNSLPDTAGGRPLSAVLYHAFQLLQDALGNKGMLAASTLSARFVAARKARTPHRRSTRSLSRCFSMLGSLCNAAARCPPLTYSAMSAAGLQSSATATGTRPCAEQAVGQTIDLKGAASPSGRRGT
jgi:hypothetical protein